jgi:hypothetical protein
VTSFGTSYGAGVPFGTLTAAAGAATIDVPFRDVRLVEPDLPATFLPLELQVDGPALSFSVGQRALLVPGTYGPLVSDSVEHRLELATSVVIGPDTDWVAPALAFGWLHGTFRFDGEVPAAADKREPFLRSPDGRTILPLHTSGGDAPGAYQAVFVLAGRYDVLVPDASWSLLRRVACVDVEPR